MGGVKYSLIPKKRYSKKGYLLTSFNVNDVTERAPHDDNGNVTLIAQGAKQDFILLLAT